jgi:hypothetical protein
MVIHKMVQLSDIISKPMSLSRLRELLPAKSKAVLYATLQKDKRNRQDIFRGINSLVVLYEGRIDGRKQGHFVCLIPRAHSISYFSSLGRAPTDEMNAFHTDPTAFKRLLGKNYTYNRKKLQLNSYTVEDCGYWVLARAILVDMKLKDFQKLFGVRSFRSSDEVLANMVFLLANLL